MDWLMRMNRALMCEIFSSDPFTWDKFDETIETL